MKRILVAAGIVILVIGIFMGGWYAKTIKTNQTNKQAFAAAEDLVDIFRTGGDTDAIYDNASEVYQGSITKEQLQKVSDELEGSELVESAKYNGPIDNMLIYQLSKSDAAYSVNIKTAKEDSGWKITSVIVNKQLAQ